MSSPQSSPSKPTRGRPPLYPFAQLTKPGETFIIPAGKGRAVASSANTWARRNNPRARFAVRGRECIRLPDRPSTLD